MAGGSGVELGRKEEDFRMENRGQTAAMYSSNKIIDLEDLGSAAK